MYNFTFRAFVAKYNDSKLSSKSIVQTRRIFFKRDMFYKFQKKSNSLILLLLFSESKMAKFRIFRVPTLVNKEVRELIQKRIIQLEQEINQLRNQEEEKEEEEEDWEEEEELCLINPDLNPTMKY